MREFHVASSVTTLTMSNVADIVFDNAASRPDHIALRRRVDGTWRDVTDRAFADEVMAAAKGFVAAGIQAGDRVAVMSKTRYEWTLVDFALFAVGAVVVPIYETSSAEQVEWILSDSGARGAVVETDEHKAIVESVRAQAPDLAHVWTIDDGAIDSLVQRRRGGRRRRRDEAPPGGHARRHRLADLHLGHDRPSRRAAGCCTAASSPSAPSCRRS